MRQNNSDFISLPSARLGEPMHLAEINSKPDYPFEFINYST